MAQTRWTPLPSLSAVATTGRDARAFLQGQLTNDLLGLDRHPGMLTAACNRQGRVLATLRLASHGEGLWLVLPREMAPLLVAHLSRFVLRADVAFGDAGGAVFGLLDAPPALQTAAAAAGLAVLVAGPGRTLLAGDESAAQQLLAGATAAAPDDWEQASIADGEPEIHPDTSGLWLPQMINLDLLGAVSFGKGCYLGQEIVARAQHLGRIKRRMLRYLAAAGPAPAPGRMLHAGAKATAQVVRSCSRGGVHCLAVVELADRAELLGTNPQGTEFVPADLPYPIPVPTAEQESLAAG